MELQAMSASVVDFDIFLRGTELAMELSNGVVSVVDDEVISLADAAGRVLMMDGAGSLL